MEIRRLILPCLMLLAGAQAWGLEEPQIVQQRCARCHGLDGVGTAPTMPHLDGQLDQYLLAAMRKYQKGRRPTEVTDHIPSGLSEGELEEIARHYATSKAERPAQQTDPAKVARGETVFISRCADCHMDSGREADKDAPVMAAQNLPYLIEQIKLFVSGKRKFGFLQDDAFRGLSLDELESVGHYFASQDRNPPSAPKEVSKRKQRR